MKNSSISAIIITKNEEDRIAACLKALGFCDEKIIVDNSSTDATESIAKINGARVVKSDMNNFSKLRDLGKSYAKGEWLLYIDADEIVSHELALEIKHVVTEGKINDAVGYRLKRVNYYFGTLWPTQELMLRLLKASALNGWQGELHETAVVSGYVEDLKNNLLHDTHRNLSEMVEKTNKWSEVEAKLRLEVNHPNVVGWRILRVMITAFFDSYIKQKGYKVGMVGIVESLYQSFSVFITYAKLWEMQQGKQ